MPASKAKRAQVAGRRNQAIALRLAGVDWETIAQRLDYASRGAACTDVNRAMEANLGELRDQTKEMRAIEALRLDRLQAAVWSKALKGDTKAVDTVLRVMDRRLRLLGLHQLPNDSDNAAARSMLGQLMRGLKAAYEEAAGEEAEGESP